ncbi:hypothetical protein AAZX31_17G106100 [Glycine max]|uniref:Uncharacterized protein GmTDF-5 n=1 Tax=Glycine max TaxID=3847 RepID=Q402G4_SOYBN|nr:uncharacterized protein LOC732564 [Glycine max]KAG4932875.1 hypothetical protein JHK87_046877 [Glycine soja]KAG4930110.1 hypothetical protein JHK86_047071 [Glycine max]KAG4943000.1 hypothetical protein JHK85_047646 [Glycine max]KAG5097325.1 hypothetical protein JHK82_047179 [Glycine max]KAG5102113.1 hypothetical protein JHK84_047082 [Glycine max]|eukprot:NP_001237031.1 uncharacterized protein LOC732564 [Glycine max]
MEEEESEKSPQLVRVLEALKEATHDIQRHHSSDSPAIKALLELHSILSSSDPYLSALSDHLIRLKTLVHSLNHSNGLLSFLTRPLSTLSLSRLASQIESEIQSWIDRETLHTLSSSLRNPNNNHEFVSLLTQSIYRVSQGFNRELQDLVLKLKLFSSLESVLFDDKCSIPVREQAGLAVSALIRFNKDVFVGQVLMGPTVRALVSMGSVLSLEVLCSLIRSIRSPLVDEIESNGEIPNIIAMLNSEDLELRVVALGCALEIGYFGRKEAVEAMMKEGLVEKLVELQRSEKGGDLIEIGREKVSGVLERKPFASCVARFAVQLEVGEGLRQREKRAFKPEILIRVRDASVSEAEAATIAAEVLWGSSP